MKRVGPYVIVEKLRGGGRAHVLLARDQRVGDDAPLVVLKIQKVDEGDFEREAAVLQRLRHPNVVSLIDFGMHSGHAYLALEYVDGTDLAGLLRAAGKIDVDLAVTIAGDVLAGLAAAHALTNEKGEPWGFVHRDVTPSNVLLSSQAQVKLADFGIAKFEQAPMRTATGVIKGKFAYLAPEQARASVADARSDVFAVGLVLFEMLSGVPVYQSNDDFVLIELAMEAELWRRWALLPALPPLLLEILQKALDPAPDDRFQSAGEFAAALQSLRPPEALARRALAALVKKAQSTPRRDD